MSQQQTSVSVGETSPDAANDYQILPNHAWSNSRANGGVWGAWQPLFFRQPILQIFEKSENLFNFLVLLAIFQSGFFLFFFFFFIYPIMSEIENRKSKKKI